MLKCGGANIIPYTFVLLCGNIINNEKVAARAEPKRDGACLGGGTA